MGSHWDLDGDHCEGTSHGIARHSWYRSPHRGADSSQVPFLPFQPEAPTQNLQSSLKYSPRSRPFSVLRVKSWHPPGTASFFLYTKPLPAAFILARAETPVFNHPSSLSAQRSWDFSQGRKPVWAHLCSSTVQWLQGLGSAQRCELSWVDTEDAGDAYCLQRSHSWKDGAIGPGGQIGTGRSGESSERR